MPPASPGSRYRQGKDEPGGARRAAEQRCEHRRPLSPSPLTPQRPAPSQLLLAHPSAPRRPPSRPGAPTHLCALRDGSSAPPPAPHRPSGEASHGGGGRRAQQGQGEQQPPLAGGCGRQAPLCPHHRHLARAGAQGIVGRRRTRARGGAGRGGSGRPEGKVAGGAVMGAGFDCRQSYRGGAPRGTASDPSWRTEWGLAFAFCEKGCPPLWCPEMGSFEPHHSTRRGCPQIHHGTLRRAALISHGATKGDILSHGALRGQPGVPP